MKRHDFPVMDTATEAKFHRDVTTLLRAGWNTGKVADWASSAASGYGRYLTRHEALVIANAVCGSYNRQQRALWQAAWNDVAASLRESFPSIAQYFTPKNN
jgi:hypothetical protein